MRLVKIATIVALLYAHSFALPYLLPSDATFGIFESRREWLTLHVLCGTLALFLGPVQFWLALTDYSRRWHRILGVAYIMCVAGSSTAAISLASATDFGWVFKTGMMTLAFVWIVTTALAVTAICRSQIQQHKEWMIRSYVVTFSFVFFEAIMQVFDFAKIGNTTERLIVASWLSWSAPLLITEVVLQGRKMFHSSATTSYSPASTAANYADYANKSV
jgi:uncharacterized membrane protein